MTGGSAKILARGIKCSVVYRFRFENRWQLLQLEETAGSWSCMLQPEPEPDGAQDSLL